MYIYIYVYNIYIMYYNFLCSCYLVMNDKYRDLLNFISTVNVNKCIIFIAFKFIVISK